MRKSIVLLLSVILCIASILSVCVEQPVSWHDYSISGDNGKIYLTPEPSAIPEDATDPEYDVS